MAERITDFIEMMTQDDYLILLEIAHTVLTNPTIATKVLEIMDLNEDSIESLKNSVVEFMGDTNNG